MGYSQDDKARHHEQIVEIASARIRESGTEAPGVAEIMRAAGLTTVASTSTSARAIS